jgi:hypothetical protein
VSNCQKVTHWSNCVEAANSGGATMAPPKSIGVEPQTGNTQTKSAQ